MGHEEISKRLGAYLDEEVGAEERAAIEKHVGECRICAGILQSLREVSALVRGSQFGRIDAAFVQKLHQKIDNLSSRGLERLAWGLSAAAACIAIVARVYAFGPGQQTQQPTQAVAVAPPDAWEGQAVQLNTNTADDAATNNNGELAMAQWMVADLSEEPRGQ